jgi:hypothetical protein
MINYLQVKTDTVVNLGQISHVHRAADGTVFIFFPVSAGRTAMHLELKAGPESAAVFDWFVNNANQAPGATPLEGLGTATKKTKPETTVFRAGQGTQG